MDGSPRATIVRQYELLLVRRHRFVLADVIDSLCAVVQTLQRAESLVLAALRGRDASRSNSTQPRTPTKKQTFYDVAEAVNTRLKQITALAPIFFGDTELEAFARALREFTRKAGTERFWKVQLTPEEYYIARELAEDVVKALARDVETLERSIEAARPTTTLLRKRREHLVWLVDEILSIVNRANKSQTEAYEAKKQRLLEDYKIALIDPTLVEVKQLQRDMQAIETVLISMLQPHLDACLPISAANAKVENAGFSLEDQEQIEAFVSLAMRLKDHSDEIQSTLADPKSFICQIQVFERAASQDLFVVYSSALKLNFDVSLDSELFLAYITDWQSKKSMRQSILESVEYGEASQRVLKLKEAIFRNETELAKSRHKKLGLDDETKAILRDQISSVFREAGGDVTGIVQIIL